MNIAEIFDGGMNRCRSGHSLILLLRLLLLFLRSFKQRVQNGISSVHPLDDISPQIVGFPGLFVGDLRPEIISVIIYKQKSV